jgi:hypothetical protein
MRYALLSVLLATGVASLAGCDGGGGGVLGSDTYAYVAAKTVSVGDGSMTVTPTKPWNRERRIFWEDVHAVEDWTQNGPLLDDVTFVTGLKDRKSLIRQDSRDAQQVPVFRSDMTAPEIASMLDSAYRVRGGAVDFQTLSLIPRPFLGTANGFQLDYQHLDSDEVWRKGRVVGAVIDGRLYLVMIDAVRSHYYPAGLPDFEQLVASARLTR